MKKLVSLLLVLILLLPVLACAEDYSTWETEQLREAQKAIRNELLSRELVAAKDTVLIDQDGVKLYLTGEHDYMGTLLRLNCVAINNSDKKVSINVVDGCVNGWDVSSVGIAEISPGKKKKGSLMFNMNDTDVSQYEEVEELEFVLQIYDMDAWKAISKTDTIILTPNK